jgi:outer membrane protein
MKTIGWIMAVLVVLLPFRTSAGTVYTLQDAIDYGLLHSPRVREAQYQTSGAENERKAVRGGFFPRLSTGYSRNILTSQSSRGPTDQDYLDQVNDVFQVNLSQVLYNGARILKDYERTRAQKEMYEAREAMARISLIYEIEAAFFRLMKAKADVAAARDTVLRLESGMDAVAAFFASQMVPRVQVLEIKSELLTARSDLSIAQNRVIKEKARLLSVMNLHPAEPVTFDGELDHYPPGYRIPFEALWQAALDARPDLLALEKQKIMAARQADMEMSRYHPRVSLDLGYFDTDRDYDAPGTGITGTFDRDQRNRYWQARVSVQWELFDGGAAWFSRHQHLDRIKALEQQILNTENAIRAELEQAVLSITEATRRIAAMAEAVETGKEYYQSEKMRLDKGISSTPAVLDAQARLTRLEANYNNARFDYQLAMANLNFLMGTLAPVEFNQN